MTDVKVDWTTANAEGQYCVYCPECDDWRWLSKRSAKDAERRQSICFLCSQARKAVLGYRAMARRWGEKWAVNHVQQWRMAHRTPEEAAVETWLDNLGLSYVSEYKVSTKAKGKRQRCYLVDVMICLQGNLYAIEIDGGVHVLHSRRDRRKASLLKRRGIPLLRLSNQQVHDSTYQSLISQFICTHKEEAYGIPTIG